MSASAESESDHERLGGLATGYLALAAAAASATAVFLWTPWSDSVPGGLSAHVGLGVTVFAMSVFYPQQRALPVPAGTASR